MSEVYVNEPSTSGKVVLHTSLGDLDIELWSRECPLACRNFLQLCCDGYYNGVIFHRVIKDFIVQTGDPTGSGRGGSDTAVNDGKLFDLEIHPRLKFRYRGLVGVANLAGGALAGAMSGRGCGINGNQFFITLGRCDALTNTHTLFGKVTGHSLYNLMKFGDLEVDKNDRPVYPPVIKGADVLWMPYPDIQPRLELERQHERVGGSSRSGAREERGGSGSKEEQQKNKLQKPDKKLLSFGEEDDEEEERKQQEEEETREGGSVAKAGKGKKKQRSREERTSSGRHAEPPAASIASRGRTSSRKILSAHDVLVDDPLLQWSSGMEGDAAEAEELMKRGGREAQRGAGGRNTDSESSDAERREAAERRKSDSRHRKRRRRSTTSSSDGGRGSSDDSSSDGHTSDDSRSSDSRRRTGGPRRHRQNSVRGSEGANNSNRKGGQEGPTSTLELVRNKLASLAAADGSRSGSSKRHGHGGATASAEAAGGEKGAAAGARRESQESSSEDDSPRSSLSDEKQQQQQQQREEKESRRKVDALHLHAGGGSASRGAHLDKERLQDSDLMTEHEKRRKLYVLQRRDTGRQRQQTETLKKLDAFTQQLRSLRQRQSSSFAGDSSKSAAAVGGSSASKKKEENNRNSHSSSGGRREDGGGAQKPQKTAEAGTLNAMLPDLDEEIDENDGSWLSGGGLRFAVDSNRAYELDEARAAASVVVYDPLRGAADVAAKKMQQRRQAQAVAWKEGRRDIEKW